MFISIAVLNSILSYSILLVMRTTFHREMKKKLLNLLDSLID